MLPDERMVEAVAKSMRLDDECINSALVVSDMEYRNDARVALVHAFAALDREALIEAGAQAAPTYGPGRIGRYAPQQRREMAEAVLRAVGLIA